MQDSTIVVIFGAATIALIYAMNFISEKQHSIATKRFIELAKSIVIVVMLISCGYILSGDDHGILLISIVAGIFLIVNFKRTKFCGACGTRNTTKFGVPNDICRRCGGPLS